MVPGNETVVGMSLLAPTVVPSLKNALEPQQRMSPRRVITQKCREPAAMSMASRVIYIFGIAYFSGGSPGSS